MRGPSGVLDERRPPRCEIALAPIAEPARPRGNVGVFGDAELGLRSMDEVSVFRGCARDAHRVDRFPPVLPQQRLRAVDRELEWLSGSGRQVEVLDELLIFVAADI